MQPAYQINFSEYVNVDNTLDAIQGMINRHKDDVYLKPFAAWSVEKIFDYISNYIPYRQDPVKLSTSNNDDIELLRSPYFTIYGGDAVDPKTNQPYHTDPGGDCDDKCIVAACIFELKGIPYVCKVVSTRPDRELHHIYLVIDYNGTWIPFDATYPGNVLGIEKKSTRAVIYDWRTGLMKRYELSDPNLNTLSGVLEKNCNGCLQNCQQREMALSGDNYSTGLYGVKMATLEGNLQEISQHEKLQLLGNLPRELLGFDPVTIITIASVASSLFGSLFGHTAYQDAYNVWNAASQAIGTDLQSGNVQQAAVDRAIVAVLGVDVMNPPGANICTSSNKCGNRAEWSAVHDQVLASVQSFAPMMYFLMRESGSGQINPMDMNSMYNYYNDFKQHGPHYQAFVPWAASHGGASGLLPSSVSSAGFDGSTLLILALITGGAYMLLSKKKKRR